MHYSTAVALVLYAATWVDAAPLPESNAIALTSLNNADAQAATTQEVRELAGQAQQSENSDDNTKSILSFANVRTTLIPHSIESREQEAQDFPTLAPSPSDFPNVDATSSARFVPDENTFQEHKHEESQVSTQASPRLSHQASPETPKLIQPRAKKSKKTKSKPCYSVTKKIVTSKTMKRAKQEAQAQKQAGAKVAERVSLLENAEVQAEARAENTAVA